ncbi:MAG: ornithine--oxo-acid transaminase [Eubacteriales bacterium]|nr:ornithine--oxo-acid transaminase [Eubacteriales bacterium]MDD4768901.1 ornithine--oxo-acid transaminase [Eubacteriales bacterium]
MKTQELLALTHRYSAPNYLPLPIVIAEAEGVWVWDPEGNRYMDMLSSYSALNQGHRHPKIIQAVKNQLDRVTLTSRAFHNDQMGPFCRKVAELTGKEKVLIMNTGAEAVETAIKGARRWAYDIKGVPDNQAEIIVCAGNFHGRTTTVISFSSTPEYYRGFGPLTPGFKIIPYGDIQALEAAITPNTAGFLVEPIQGEAGVVVPPEGYMRQAAKICRENNVLLLADEIQTGFGRTGKLFCCDWEEVEPDVYIMGKAMGGGVIPVSAVAASSEFMDLFNPGSHGSTFGGNPLGCACAIAAIDVIKEEKLVERSLELGKYLMAELKKIKNPLILEIRGKGLFIGVVLSAKARPYCESLKAEGILCKETHENVIRFAPPLVISKEEIDWALERVRKVLG